MGKRILLKTGKHIVLDIFLVIQLMPLVWLLLFSLKDNNQIFNRPAFSIPSPFVFENYARVFQNLQIHIFVCNSAVVTAMTMLVTLLFASMAAYACTRMRFRYGETLIMVFLAGIMIPVHGFCASGGIIYPDWFFENASYGVGRGCLYGWL